MVEHLVEAQSVLGSSPNLSTSAEMHIRVFLGGYFPPTYLNIVFNGSTSALGAFRVSSNLAIQTREESY